MTSKKSRSQIKLDRLNREIITRMHAESNITNQRLADDIGLSPAACSQRVNALREAGYFFDFHCEVDLDRTFEHVLAYVEFRLQENTAPVRRKFEAAVEMHPELMDCMRLSGGPDYISFACARSLQALNEVCDELSADPKLKIARIDTRVILERTKWYLGYPLAKLKWLQG